MYKALDKNGAQVKVGDIVEMVVKYVVDEITSDGNILAHKVYDLPSSAVQITGGNLVGD